MRIVFSWNVGMQSSNLAYMLWHKTLHLVHDSTSSLASFPGLPLSFVFTIIYRNERLMKMVSVSVYYSECKRKVKVGSKAVSSLHLDMLASFPGTGLGMRLIWCMRMELAIVYSARDNRVTPNFGESRQAAGTMSRKETGLVRVHTRVSLCNQVFA